MKQYDVITLGAGAAALTAITSLNGTGLKCAIVEEDKPGGECTYYGCVPTKTILSITEALGRIKEYKDLFSTEDQKIIHNLYPDYRKITQYKRTVVDRFSKKGSWEPFISSGIDVYNKHATFISAHELKIDDEVIWGKYIIIATGAHPRIPEIPGLRQTDYLTHVEALELMEKPKSIAIVGAGAIGMEFAQFFADMGVKTTVIQRSDHILSKEDPEMADVVEEHMKSLGVTFIKNATVQSVRSVYSNKKSLHVVFGSHEQEVLVEHLLVSIGMLPRTEGIGLEKAGVKLDAFANVDIDDTMKTSVDHIYSCGDVTGKYLFTHFAEYQANIIAYNIQNPDNPLHISERVIPWATYTDPPLARVGLIERDARKRYGDDLLVARLDFSDVERARMMRAEKGRIKILVKKSDGLMVGATIVGPWADGIIHECVLAMQMNIHIQDVFNMIHIYPTLSEGIKWTLGKVL